jgi:hypothetical protein
MLRITPPITGVDSCRNLASAGTGSFAGSIRQGNEGDVTESPSVYRASQSAGHTVATRRCEAESVGRLRVLQSIMRASR